MNSGDSGAVAAGWTSVAGAPWFLRDTTYGEPNGDYHTGCWLYSTFYEGQGYTFNDANCGVCFTDYLCSRNSVAGFPWAASLWNPDQSALPTPMASGSTEEPPKPRASGVNGYRRSSSEP